MSDSNDPDFQFPCPHCQKVMRNRDLLTTTTHLKVEKCRSCGEIISKEEISGTRNSEAETQDDISSIGNWLSEVGGLDVKHLSGQPWEMLWSIRGLPFSGFCEAVYDHKRPAVVVLRLRREGKANSEELKKTCSSFGVHPAGVSGSKPWWGAEQALLTSRLMPDLFRPVVDRLNKVLEEVASIEQA